MAAKKDSSDTSEFKYIKEIQFGVLALVAGLGFFKVEDLKSFINVIAQLMVNDVASIDKHDISVYFFAGFATLAYLFYFFGFGFALFTMFRDGKNFTKAILFSIASYFIMYFFLVILIFKGPYTSTKQDEKHNLMKNEATPAQHDNIPAFNGLTKDIGAHNDTATNEKKQIR
ncbi:MAG: hypothetical protein NTZ69_04120 [Bacteroidia bacterium]|nr:hypothetical protein [Bacteroidia bacterium]